MAVGGSQNCTTTVLALTLGPQDDPEVSYRVEAIQQWFVYWKAAKTSQKDVRTVWPKVVRRFMDSLAPWSQVTSLLSNVIITLLYVGVYPYRPDLWIGSAAGKVANFQFPSDPFGSKGVEASFLQHLRAAIQTKLWNQAASHRHGKGLEDGTDVASVVGYYNYLRKHKRYKDAGILYAMATAGLWPAERRSTGSDLCPRCGLKVETDFHIIYECICNKDAIRDTIDANGEEVHDGVAL